MLEEETVLYTIRKKKLQLFCYGMAEDRLLKTLMLGISTFLFSFGLLCC